MFKRGFFYRTNEFRDIIRCLSHKIELLFVLYTTNMKFISNEEIIRLQHSEI